MILNVAGIFIFLSLYGIVVSSPDRAVDCRKFVFAPLCRGVAAKRTSIGNGHYDHDIHVNEESVKHLLRHLYSAISPIRILDDEYNKTGIPTENYEPESLGKKYQQDRYKGFLKLLLKNRGYSERNNLPTQGFENL